MYSKKTFLRIIEKSTPPFNEVSLEALKSIVEVDFKYDKRKWAEWYKKSGFRNPEVANQYYARILKQQQEVDNGPVLR